MTFTVSVEETDVAFPCEGNETVLDAAERAGYTLPYSCRKGVCATCEGRLTLGAAVIRSQSVTAPASDVLLCQTKPTSDLVIQPKRIDRYDPRSRKRLTAKVYRLQRPSGDVAILNLRFPAGVRAKFEAGQYLRVTMPNGDTRNFSMANPPHESDGVQLHIRHVPGGAFSEQVLATLEQGDTLEIELPFGDFYLRGESSTGLILLASGTGFAPLKSIVENLIKRGSTRNARLYWGGRRPADLYLRDIAEKWVKRAPWLTFVPVLSEPDDSWEGRRGLVHKAVLEDIPDLSAWQVYACGNPMMIKRARRDFGELAKLAADQFFADPFVPSGNVDEST